MLKAICIAIVSASLLAACTSTPPTEPVAAEQKASDNRVKLSLPTPDARSQQGSALTQRSIYFDYDKDALKPEYQSLIQAHARFLAEHPKLEIKLEGNTDERGTAEYNLALGQRRAEVVAKAISIVGAPRAKVEAISFGKEKPKADGHDESSWAKNRRVDIRYSDEP